MKTIEMSLNFPISAKELREYKQKEFNRKKMEWITNFSNQVSGYALNCARNGCMYYTGPTLTDNYDINTFPLEGSFPRFYVKELIDELKKNFPDCYIYTNENNLIIDWRDFSNLNESDHKLE